MNEPGDAGRSLTVAGERPRSLRDLSDAGTLVVDEQGRIVEVNPRAERLLGRAAADMLGRDGHDLLHRGRHGETLPRSRCTMRRPLLSGITVQGEHERWERGDGSLLSISWTVTPCRIADDATGALVLFHTSDPGVAADRTPAVPASSLSELDRLALLAETTTTLTASLDPGETLRQLVHLVVPLLADWAVVDLLTEEGEVSRAAVVHYEDGALAHRRDLEGAMPPVPQESSMPLSRALRGVTAALAGPQDYQGPPDSGIAVVQRELFEATGIHSASIAPIRGVRDVVGALTLGRAERPGAYTTSDLLLVEDIARRAGLALDNARLYQRQRRVSETMQRHLLPRIPRVPGLEMRACYLPAPHASQVGGDWYDVFVLGGGATGLVIGDVVGHDLDAASGMAQICYMLRAYAGERDEPPSRIVERLDQAAGRMAETTMATAILARVEPSADGWRLRWTNAGHPPPLLVERDGRTRYLEGASGLLLGTGLPVDRDDTVADLPPRSTLLLYTDGLIESRSHTLDEGMLRLSRHAAALAQRPLGGVCDELLSRVRPTDNDDDVAMLAVRIPG
ncbi:SpoIIE family protein phosphatase [Nonomuraea sp. NN258]|uniref:SpoIIE family protein phosphatase n=1 Tax=Nonomuraea antri TaxID=2730852 RepID=UPI001568FBE8|nr:SpoIIE family protein phosphatase [Nonomuraea antri]NRQ39796.1 SpoIIE family protein phosphatase [Nonomuraea antri]